MHKPALLPRAATNAARPPQRNPRRVPLMLGTALGAVLSLGYGRGAYGQQICVGGPPNFTCAGSSTDEQFLDIFGNNLNATALPGFQVVTTDANGLRFLTTFGDLTFTDSATGSIISGAVNGMNLSTEIGSLTVTANGSVTATLGSGLRASVLDGDATHGLTVTTGATSTISGGDFGIRLRQSGLGALTVTANGTVSGASPTSTGLYTWIYEPTNASALTITTGSGSNVTGGWFGIAASHAGTGRLSVEVNGTVTASNAPLSYGVDATLSNPANTSELSVTTAAGSLIAAHFVGLRASRGGTGALNVTVDGTALALGTAGIGVETRITNTASTGALTLSTGATSLIQGGQTGINAMHYGLGDLTVTARGTVTGGAPGSTGLSARVINATSSGTISVTTAAGSTVSGADRGITARHAGTGAVGVTVNGTVSATGVASTGVYAVAAGATGAAPLTVTTGAGSSVSGGGLGLYARHSGLGSVEVTVAGTALASTGIYARISNANNAAAMTVTTEDGSSVTGDARGIAARHQGTGALTVSIGGTVTGTNSTGVRAHVDNLTSGGTLTVTTATASTITGYDRGITALHDGEGAISVTVDGSVEGTTTTSMGVYARAYNAANAAALTVTTGADSSVTALRRGVYALHDGTGAVGVTVNGQVQATGANSWGVYAGASNSANAAALTVTTGAASSVTGDLGINALHQGTGALSVTANGAVTGTVAYGITARIEATAATGALTVTTGADSTVTGPSRGIYAFQGGTGALTATINGTVLADGPNSTGLRARISNAPNTNALTVTTGVGSQVSGDLGINALHQGTGALSVTANGAVTGTVAYGITARIENAAATGALTVTTGAASNVTGGYRGIYARQVGSGALSVTANGLVQGTSNLSSGLVALMFNYTTTAELSVTTGAGSGVTAAMMGISATHQGLGALRVMADGTVTATSGLATGLTARLSNSANYAALTVTTGAGSSITAGGRGIDALHQGRGALSVTVNGAVTGTGVEGLRARSLNSANFADLTVTTGAGSSVTGAARGISALHMGGGSLSVSVGGAVTGTTGLGLYARIGDVTNMGLLSVTTGTDSAVTGATRGIYARHDGFLGTLSVTVDGQATGTGYEGVRARVLNATSLVALTVTTGADSAVTGGTRGIYAVHNGGGAVNVTIDGVVTGTTTEGLYARITNVYSGAPMTVTTGAGSAVTGSTRGIEAFQNGTGALSVTANGTVTGNGDFGIWAVQNNANSTYALTVTTGAGSSVTGGSLGIYAQHTGTGALSVTANGTVTTGIFARATNATNAAALTVTTGADSSVTGEFSGIYANHQGTGALSVTANGTVTGTGVISIGISALAINAANAAALTVTAGADSSVTSNRTGIYALHSGLGSVSVTADGTVEGRDRDGILAGILPLASTGTVTITTGADSLVRGGANGILAATLGLGSIVVTVNGTVEGVADAGIAATIYNPASTAALTITTGAGSEVLSGGIGILAQNFGAGNLMVDLGADSLVEGEQNGGINARQLGSGALTVAVGEGGAVRSFNAAITGYSNGDGPLRITTGAGSTVGGGVLGISADMNGLGDLRIAVNGRVEAAGVAGITAFINNPLSAAALDITLGANAEVIVPVGPGINTVHRGAGDLTVTTALNSRVEGAQPGIWATHMGTGALTITAGGAVSGSAIDSEGIDAWIFTPGSTAALTIQTAEGSVVSGGADGILARHAGTGAVAVSAAGAVNGGTGAAIRTEALAGSGQTITVGATGAIAAASGQAIAVEGAAVEIENLGLITGFVALTGGADLFTNDGTWVAAGQTSAFGGGNDRFENRGTLVAANASTQGQSTLLQDLEIFLNLGGLIRMQNGFAGDVLEVSGDFVADGGVLALDVQVAGNASTADRLVIGGDAQRAGAATGIHVVQTTAAGDRDDDGILLVQVAGTSAADAFTLANPAPLELGAFVYDLTLGACDGAGGSDWYLCATDQPGSIATLYEGAPAVLLGGFAILPSLFERLRQRQPLGEAEATRGPSILPGPDSRFGGVWMRLHGERADVAPRTSTAGTTFRRTNWGLQLGAEMLAAEGDGGDWVLGATAQYGRVSATVRNTVGIGQIAGQGWGIGFTATWQGLGGTYVDLQGQANRVSVDYSTAAHGLLAGNVTARTQALSAEIGHRHAVSPSLTLVPQAQLAWGSVDGGSFTDALGNAVALGRGSTTSGRIGLAWEYSPAGAGPEDPLVYGILNIRHDFSAPDAVSVAGTPLLMRAHPTQGEIGLGGTVPLSANAVLYGQASFRAPFGAAAGNRTVSASAGLRVRW